ncbi:pyridoxal phosphate-dependent aminotransferase [Streptosporangium lutulentum]|uniref:Aspartate/methionine/tyrosine aminotransferase n=1 Tax=Streptosporangium lutulentum TaxID=1461250 RepID=A0ABT9QVF6_9ACTN|nr:pyridoxal phosphate-dependent aminotransferase [Streptosporangium lutulentum]MDP9850415.1 aspartate/methionine/tyrosine aminotransferase [Streptosporangium lutulentum]
MSVRVGRRGAAVIAHRYDDFPVGAGDLDLRGDTSAPLDATLTILQRFTPSTEETAGYGDVAGDLSLRQTLGGLFGVDAGHVVVTVGGSEALHLALTCLTDPGDPIALPRPAFPGYDQLAHLAGLRPVHYPVPGPLPAPTGMPLLVCTPHNPTGVTTNPTQVADRPGGVIWDVCHSSLTAPQIDGVRAALQRGDVVVFSLSKLLRLPGLRIGCLIAADAAFIGAAVAVKTHLSMSVDLLAQRLAGQILTHPGALKEVAARSRGIGENRGRVLEAVAGCAALDAVAAKDGTFVYLQAPDGCDAARLLHQAGVIGLPGTVFNGTPSSVRLCIAQNPDVIDQTIERITDL